MSSEIHELDGGVNNPLKWHIGKSGNPLAIQSISHLQNKLQLVQSPYGRKGGLSVQLRRLLASLVARLHMADHDWLSVIWRPTLQRATGDKIISVCMFPEVKGSTRETTDDKRKMSTMPVNWGLLSCFGLNIFTAVDLLNICQCYQTVSGRVLSISGSRRDVISKLTQFSGNFNNSYCVSCCDCILKWFVSIDSFINW